MQRADIAAELTALRADDEATRTRLARDASFFHGAYHPEIQAVHRRNGDRLDAIS